LKFSDLLICRDSGDLKLAIDALATYWYAIPAPDRPGGDIGQLASDVLSYRHRLEGLPKPYMSTLWTGVSYLLEKLNGTQVSDLVSESKVIKNESAITPGKYWIVNGNFHRCDDYKSFVLENPDLFIDALGVDGWRLMRSKYSKIDDAVRLMLVSGASLAEIGTRDGKKHAKYQCCQSALAALKKMSSKMAIKTSFFRIYDPSKLYAGFGSGILFVVRH
jgi:hypothetical protein